MKLASFQVFFRRWVPIDATRGQLFRTQLTITYDHNTNYSSYRALPYQTNLQFALFRKDAQPFFQFPLYNPFIRLIWSTTADARMTRRFSRLPSFTRYS